MLNLNGFLFYSIFFEVKLQNQNSKTNCGDPTNAKSTFLHLTVLSPFLFELWNICSSSSFWIMSSSIFLVCTAILLFPDKIQIRSTELKLWISICFTLLSKYMKKPASQLSQVLFSFSRFLCWDKDYEKNFIKEMFARKPINPSVLES